MSQNTAEFVREAGGSIVSRNVLDGKAPIRWAVREDQVNPVDNGWRSLSAIDDDEYLDDPAHMAVVDFNTVVGIEPAVLPLLYLPAGTDITIDRGSDGRISLVDNNTGSPLEV